MLDIAGQHRFYAALSKFLGYWAGKFSELAFAISRLTANWHYSIRVREQLYFRKGKFALYDIRSCQWNVVPSQPPLGATLPFRICTCDHVDEPSIVYRANRPQLVGGDVEGQAGGRKTES